MVTSVMGWSKVIYHVHLKARQLAVLGELAIPSDHLCLAVLDTLHAVGVVALVQCVATVARGYFKGHVSTPLSGAC